MNIFRPRKLINLTVGTRGKGGISSVLRVLNEYGFYKKWNVKFITTHTGFLKYKFFLLPIVFCTALLTLIYYFLFYKVGIVHVHMASRGSYIRKACILRLAKYCGAKTIIHLHGAEFNTFYSKECSERKKRHIQDTFNKADKVIVLSHQWLAWIGTIISDKNKASIVYNATPKFEIPEKKSTLKQTILFLGRLGQRKGVEDLINAFSKISENFPRVQLHLGGDGDLVRYQSQASALGISDKVFFLGWITGDKKLQCLSDATIYCLPSYNEGFPMGVLEAMSAEVAVVASTAGGIPDAITDDKEGLLIEAGDIDALADALTTMLEDENKRAMYIMAAKAKFINNFSPEVIIPKLNDIYQGLLDTNK